MKILVLNGPNLNMTGIRKKNVYGAQTLDDINAELKAYGESKGAEMSFYQSNHEGDIIDLMDTIKTFDLTYDDTKDNNSISLSEVREMQIGRAHV